ncbi:hypothetical protein BpHYR1_033192 [Brachionus plicatilis]|uniref:Uncharacterized protein n=1 Tax=Brachionus plicatilis TaxID=10195 RepID=A0A3M7QPA2_BRAPC|nr:hypothetical protein BpHYR1_033192 [Brachionus plicatilis]
MFKLLVQNRLKLSQNSPAYCLLSNANKSWKCFFLPKGYTHGHKKNSTSKILPIQSKKNYPFPKKINIPEEETQVYETGQCFILILSCNFKRKINLKFKFKIKLKLGTFLLPTSLNKKLFPRKIINLIKKNTFEKNSPCQIKR